MQRLDGEFHANLRGVIDQVRDAFSDLFSIFDQGNFGFGAADQDNLRSSDGGGLIQSTDIVFVRFAMISFVEIRKESAADQRDRT